MTHLTVDAVARRLNMAGYWHVLTAEAKDRCQRSRIKQMVEGRQRQRRAEGEGRSSPGPIGGAGIGRPPLASVQEAVRQARPGSGIQPSSCDSLNI